MKQEHEMTPGVLVSGEVLSAGDARARVAVLEAEVAELRKRVCVPEGHVVVPLNFVKSFRSLAHNYSLQAVPPEYYDGMAGDAFKDAFARCGRDLRNLRAMLAAAPAPVERNQCDGCQAGIPVESGMHRMGKPGGYADLMACTADRYGSAPVERVEPKTGVLVGEPEIVGERCADGGTCHHGCTDECWRKTGCGPLTCSGLNDDWSSPPAGFAVYRCPHCAASMQIAAPQPAPTACTGKNCGSTDPNLHSAECFAEHEQAIAPTSARKAPPEDPLCGIEYRADGEANFYTLSAATGSCSGQQFPDSDLSFSSTTAGGTRPLC